MRLLELKTVPCEFVHVNVRKEGNEEKGLRLANDLKLVFEADGTVALAALGCKDLVKAFYPNGHLLPADGGVEIVLKACRSSSAANLRGTTSCGNAARPRWEYATPN